MQDSRPPRLTDSLYWKNLHADVDVSFNAMIPKQATAEGWEVHHATQRVRRYRNTRPAGHLHRDD